MRLLAPLAQDLAEWRLRAGRPPADALVFPGHDGGPWSPRALPELAPADLPAGGRGRGRRAAARPYDLRHSFVSLLIAEGHNVVEVARQAGHSPKMALDTYAHVFEEFDPAERINAADRIRKAREELRFAGAAADALRRRVTAALDTYAELRLAEGKLLRWGEREAKAACALQPRDLEILVALARYRFLTTGQIAELWWEGRGLRAVRRRMTRLFDAGFVERFRPQTLRGSYQWTYCLARDGFRAAQQTGELAAGPEVRAAPRGDLRLPLRHPRPAHQRVGAALPRAARRSAARLGRPGRVALSSRRRSAATRST